jgi:hypothetical protein
MEPHGQGRGLLGRRMNPYNISIGMNINIFCSLTHGVSFSTLSIKVRSKGETGYRSRKVCSASMSLLDHCK